MKPGKNGNRARRAESERPVTGKTASVLLAGRLLPRLVIMHSSAETTQAEHTDVQAYRMSQLIGVWRPGPKTNSF